MNILKNLLVISLVSILVGCSKSPLEHQHIDYLYSISYGTSVNSLDKTLEYTCSEYSHGSYIDSNTCPDSISTIDEYTCAVDGRLYLSQVNTVKYSQHSYDRTASIVRLEGIYCKVNKSIVTNTTLIYDFSLKKDIPKF